MNESTFVETTFVLMDHLFGQSEGYMAFWSAERMPSTSSPGKTQFGKKKSEFMRNDDRNERLLRNLFKRDRRGWDVYMSPLLYSAERRIAANALHLTALYADGDGALVPAELPQPTATIESSPGRHHYLWALANPVETGPGEELNKRLTAAIGCDPSGTDLAQLIRLPGTHNHKYSDAPEVQLLELSAATYSAEELDSALPKLERLARGHGARTHWTASVPLVGASGPPVTLAPLAHRMWSGKSNALTQEGHVDRSASLFRIARVLLEAGAAPDITRVAIEERDVSLGWNKFSRRADGDERYWAIVHAVLESDVSLSQKSFPCTDLGNAERLEARHGKDLKSSSGRWRVWDGTRYKLNEAGAKSRAMENARAIGVEADSASSLASQAELRSHGKRSESNAAITAAMKLAQNLPLIHCEESDFDALPMKLNVANGTLDLSTGKLAPHDRSELHSKVSPVAWDSSAKCPTWRRFLVTTFGGNRQMIRYIQRLFGYALTGSTREQALFLFYGTGANGKSTLLSTMQRLLGDYAQQFPADALLVRPNGGPRNDIARLAGARLAVASEINEGQHLDEAIVKQLTGGDTMSARFLHQEFFEFEPVCKIVLATNKIPTIRGADNGIWRRLQLSEFGVTIPSDKQDHRLAEKLRHELPGILTWAVEGCLKWQNGGLRPPFRVVSATDEYRIAMDVFGQFLRACSRDDSNGFVATATLLAAYSEWAAETNTRRRFSTQELSAEMKSRGYVSRSTGRQRGFAGVRIAPLYSRRAA